ncbi:MAG: hypothetical protein Q7S40_05025 [Opitutaceae bacterium]|nr:hypothetical protein [Opitutaceae bacterium]
MKRLVWLAVYFGSLVLSRAAEWLPVEKQVAEAVAPDQTSVVHFWAPWCPNCNAELSNETWAKFISANPNVKFIFVTVWSRDQGDGRALLAKNGIAKQKNFRLVMHPNTSTRVDEKATSFMGLPLTWIPATWVFRSGKLRYALNYGELRFPVLQQLLKDTEENWDR